MSRDFQGNMRGPGQKNRGRGPRNNMMGGGGNPNNNNRPRPPNRMQNFDSSGPSVKIRGNAYQVFERYIAMAREASSSGDRVAAENLYQHAEHYYRIMQANGEGQQNQMGQGRPMTPADNEMNPGDMDNDGQPMPPVQQQPMPQPQPVNQPVSQQQPQQPHNPQHYQQQPRQNYQQPQHQPQPQPQHSPGPMPPQTPQPVVQAQPQPPQPRVQPEPQPPAPPPGSDTPQGS